MMYYSTRVPTSTVQIAWCIFLLSLGVSLFVLPMVNAQDLEVDIAPAAPREVVNYDEDVIDGAFYFRLMCWGCHAGQTRGGKAPDLFSPQWLYGWTDDGIFQTVFNGLPGTQMQKFGGKLSDEAINMIVGYVRSETSESSRRFFGRYTTCSGLESLYGGGCQSRRSHLLLRRLCLR